MKRTALLLLIIAGLAMTGCSPKTTAQRGYPYTDSHGRTWF